MNEQPSSLPALQCLQGSLKWIPGAVIIRLFRVLCIIQVRAFTRKSMIMAILDSRFRCGRIFNKIVKETEFLFCDEIGRIGCCESR